MARAPAQSLARRALVLGRAAALVTRPAAGHWCCSRRRAGWPAAWHAPAAAAGPARRSARHGLERLGPAGADRRRRQQRRRGAARAALRLAAAAAPGPACAPQSHADCCTPAAAGAAGAPALGRRDADGGRRTVAVAGRAAGGPGHALEHPAARRRSALATQGLSVEWIEGRLAVAGRAELDGAAAVVAPVYPEAHGQLPHHPQRGRHAHAAAGNAGRQPAADRQRPVGRFAPALHRRASAAPEREAALSNLLNIIGRRNGARSIITIG